jgi:hypothetical protein
LIIIRGNGEEVVQSKPNARKSEAISKRSLIF